MNFTFVFFLNLNKINNKKITSKIDFNSIKIKGFSVNLKKKDSTKGQNGGLQVANSETIFEFVSEYTLKAAMFFAINK